MRTAATLLILLLLLAGCQSITEERAQVLARAFIATQVKLFARENATVKTDIAGEGVELVSSQKTAAGYDFAYNLSGTVDGQPKSALVTVSVSNAGKVVSLNGQRVPG